MHADGRQGFGQVLSERDPGRFLALPIAYKLCMKMKVEHVLDTPELALTHPACSVFDCSARYIFRHTEPTTV